MPAKPNWPVFTYHTRVTVTPEQDQLLRRYAQRSLVCGRAMSYCFLRDPKGWRVFVSTEASPVKRITDRRFGAIGIDINADQLVLAEVDRHGNFKGGEHIACVTYGKTQKQGMAILGNVANQAIQPAVRTTVRYT